MRPRLALVAALAVLYAPGMPARAAEVHIESDDGREVLVYSAEAGESNGPLIGRPEHRADEELLVADYGYPWGDGANIEIGSGCHEVQRDPYSQPEIRCLATVDEVRVFLGDRDDRASMYGLGPIRRFLDGGSGDDELDLSFFGMRGALRLDGGPGNDRLYGGDERTRLEGGPGDDLMIGGLGADTFSGGAGADTVSYGDMSFGGGRAAVVVFLNLDGRGPDGADGERDRIAGDVENAGGGPLGDELIGNRGANSLTGGEGDDDILGGGGRDRLTGGFGDDRIRSRDGRRDVVGCGGGDGDRAFVDQFDDVGVECEVIRLRRTHR
jgi:hypothetical protein